MDWSRCVTTHRTTTSGWRAPAFGVLDHPSALEQIEQADADHLQQIRHVLGVKAKARAAQVRVRKRIAEQTAVIEADAAARNAAGAHLEQAVA